jgi:hypothetical protein
MRFYVIGDSHSAYSFVNVPNVISCHVGPITMHRIGRGTMTISLPNDGWWIFCFGEIDVRCHIYKQIEKGRLEDEVIQTLVTHYIHTLTVLAENHSIGVMSIVPPMRYSVEKNNSEYPFIGTDEDRARYTRKMNELLIHACSLHGWLYLDLYHLYVDEHGFLPEELSDGTVHIGNTERIRRYMQEIIKM